MAQLASMRAMLEDMRQQLATGQRATMKASYETSRILNGLSLLNYMK